MPNFGVSFIAFLLLFLTCVVLALKLRRERRARLDETNKFVRSVDDYQTLVVTLRHDLTIQLEENANVRLKLANAASDAVELVTKNVVSSADLSKAREALKHLTIELYRANQRIINLEEVTSVMENIQVLRDKLEAHENKHELIAAGLYPLSLEFGTPDKLRAKLETVRDELADMVRNKTAAVCSLKWTINGSTAEGSRATRHYIRIMLRTFNADADACLDLIRWNNLDKCTARLRTSFEYVNDLGSTHSTSLQAPYFEARIRQLQIMFEYKEAVHKQKEALRAARQTVAEERRASREIERARAEAEVEENRYIRAINRAREEISILVGNERDQMQQTIVDLEKKLEQASFLKQRAISMAQITRAGFVYVVSNIGSFGLDVLKIGMTRRIDPQERIRELGGASVPFHFDVHAMIYSENAPELENTFHRQFARRRINLANGRKEFFRVSLSDVVEFSRKLMLDAEFSTQPEAKDFHISNQLRESVISLLSDEELNAQLTAMDYDIATTAIDDDDLEEFELKSVAIKH